MTTALPQGEAPRRGGPGRARTVAAALVWAVALGIPLALGGGRLQTLLTGHAQDPMVEVGVVGGPTLAWTSIGRGKVGLTYEMRLLGAGSAAVTVTSGTTTDPGAPVRGRAEQVELHEGQTLRRTLELDISCAQRTKVGVTVTGAVAGDSTVYTWVRPTQDSKGHLACSLN